MNFFKALFGGKEERPEEKERADEAKRFDVLKYDGVRALRSGQADYAIKCFTHALRINEDLEIRDYMSQACIRADRLPEAYEHLLQIIKEQPDNLQVYMRIAEVAYMMEDYTSMADACEKAMLIDGNNDKVAYLYAKACLGHGDAVNAVAMLTQAVSINPDNAEAYLLRGETLLDGGDVTAADDDVLRLLKDGDASEEALLLKARIEKAKGENDVAIHYYDRVIDVNPFNIDAYRERGDVKTASGDVDGGKEDFAYADELARDNDGNVAGSHEDVAKKIKDAYDSINPIGL